MIRTSMLTAIGLAVTVTGSALAQQNQGQAQQQQTAQNQQQNQGDQVDVIRQGVVGLDEWDYEGLYQEDTWTAEQLLDAAVYGPGGDETGEVENIVVGTGGLVEALIIEFGGFWDIGDTHARVPWSEVEVTLGGTPSVQVPVTEETVEDYDLFGGVGGEFQVVDDDDPFTPRGWRVTELIDDYVTLEDGMRYGWVEDLVFDQAGRLEAVVVDAAYGTAYGPYAYPYYGYGYGFRPGYNYYEMPYGEDDLIDLDPFDYDRFGGIG